MAIIFLCIYGFYFADFIIYTCKIIEIMVLFYLMLITATLSDMVVVYLKSLIYDYVSKGLLGAILFYFLIGPEGSENPGSFRLQKQAVMLSY